MDENARAARREVAATIERAGFDRLSADAIAVEVTATFERKLGACRSGAGSVDGPDGDPAYVIRLASRLFEGGNDEDDDGTAEPWRDTVRHEVAHAAVLEQYGGAVDPHGPEWKTAARRAGADPRARYEGDTVDIDEDYVVACPAGCFDRGYLKRAKRVKHPWRYACAECETPLVSHDAEARPDDPTPGTCHVSSIPWSTAEEAGEDVEEGDRVGT